MSGLRAGERVKDGEPIQPGRIYLRSTDIDTSAVGPSSQDLIDVTDRPFPVVRAQRPVPYYVAAPA